MQRSTWWGRNWRGLAGMALGVVLGWLASHGVAPVDPPVLIEPGSVIGGEP